MGSGVDYLPIFSSLICEVLERATFSEAIQFQSTLRLGVTRKDCFSLFAIHCFHQISDSTLRPMMNIAAIRVCCTGGIPHTNLVNRSFS